MVTTGSQTRQYRQQQQQQQHRQAITQVSMSSTSGHTNSLSSMCEALLPGTSKSDGGSETSLEDEEGYQIARSKTSRNREKRRLAEQQQQQQQQQAEDGERLTLIVSTTNMGSVEEYKWITNAACTTESTALRTNLQVAASLYGCLGPDPSSSSQRLTMCMKVRVLNCWQQAHRQDGPKL